MSYQRQPQAFYEGHDAYFQDVNRHNNPYPTGSENYVEWNRGYSNGRIGAQLAGLNKDKDVVDKPLPWTEAILLVK